jgi:hypothetical protein
MQGSNTKPRPKRRWRALRWFVRGLCVGGALLVVLLAGVVALAHSLDRAWVKQRVRAFLLASNGLDVDYGAVQLGLWSTLDVRDLVVRSPKEVRAVAPELLRVGHLSAHWSPATLMAPGLNLRDVTVERVTLTIATDEHGKSSIDYALPGPSTPLPRLVNGLLGVGWPIRKLRISDVTLALVHGDHGKAVERDTLRGFALSGDAEPSAGATRLRVALGTTESPLALDLEEQRGDLARHTASARASLTVQATQTEAHVALAVDDIRQNFAPPVATNEPLRMELTARFDVKAHRTLVSLARFEFGSMATAEGVFELPDNAAPAVRHARVDADLGALRRLAPSLALPARFEQGHVHCVVDDFTPANPTSSAAVAAHLDLSELHVALANGGELAGERLAIDVALQRGAGGMLSGNAQFKFAALNSNGHTPIAANEGDATLRLHEVMFNSDAPLMSRGEVWLDANFGSVRSDAQLRVNAPLRFRAHTLLSGSAPLALDADLSSEHVRVARPDGRPLIDTPLHAALTLKDVRVNLAQPAQSDAIAHLGIEVGPHSVAVDVTKRADTLVYELTAHAPELAAAVPFLSPDLASQVPWNKVGVELHSRGSIARSTATEPELHQQSEIQLTGASYRAFETRVVLLDLKSDGTANRQKAHLDLRVQGLAAFGSALGDDHLALSVAFDRTRPSLELELDNDDFAKAELKASLAFDRAEHTLAYDISSHISHISSQLVQMQAFTGVDLSTLDLQAAAQGNLAGVVTPSTNGELSLASDALDSARGSGTLTLISTGVSWANGDRAFRAPAATLHATVHLGPQKRTVESDIACDAFELALGRHHLDVTGFQDQTSLAISGPLAGATLDISQQASVNSLKQNFAPTYPVGNANLSVQAHRDADGVVQVSNLRVENQAGGSTLTASGGIDLSDDQRRFTLRANLQQDLERVSSRRDVFFGSGHADLDLAVQSPDFRVFHNQATLRLDDVHAHFTHSQVALDEVNGEVPVLLDLTADREGVELLRGVQVNPYATLRFADQHPLLSTRSFLSIGHLTTPMVSIAPFAANLKVEQNIVSLSQLELGVRGGSITGDGVFDWNGGQSTLQADVHASGVQSSHGEPFDGNAALLIDLGDRSIEGRADILRIGRRHLLDLLDLDDPHRANAAMNRVRSVLTYGYPERVRITFKHGFASAGVSFGGLAGLVSVDDVRGIPVGPLMERTMSAFSPEQEP